MKITSTLFGTKALELRDGLEETINQNITLSNEKKLIEEKLTLGNLTHNENIRLRQELNDMEGSLERNKDKMDSMASELENLRVQIKNKEQVEEKKFDGLGSLFGSEQKPQPSKTNMAYQDSVHQGDHVGQKVDSQTINDPDAIARIALESYKQAMKDMREKEW
jgi:predicted nuclease with TOPRIM domain